MHISLKCMMMTNEVHRYALEILRKERLMCVGRVREGFMKDMN